VDVIKIKNYAGENPYEKDKKTNYKLEDTMCSLMFNEVLVPRICKEFLNLKS
jgi:hypothetical protein